ncbi:MAG: ABC transporter ATP-binding protein [Ruminococcus sp.]|nr:ABC transporter ATP-binding protein [Ruminococcus sp.]
MNSEPIIVLKNVSKTYTLYKNDSERFRALFKKPKKLTTHKALDNVSLEIRKGEAVGIMGDNGGGKSTLLKHITGVTFPDEGEIHVNGMVAALLELTAGFVLEMTGRENIRLKGYILGLKDEEIDKIEENVIDFAELGVYIDQPVRTYSSGMKMRLGFAINVNISPDIMVIDEALAVGDASFKTKCKAKIRQIIETGVTVLYVSHNASSVEEICERSIFLKKGKKIFDGPTKETHLVYLLDKRKSQIAQREKKIKELKKVIDNAEDKSLLIDEQETLDNHIAKVETFKKEIADYEIKLENFRKEHYGDKAVDSDQ